MPDYARARSNMVESQIRTNKVTDEAVLDAFAQLPRELFLDPAMRGVAYVDEDLPLGHGRYMLEPMVLARLIQALKIERTDLVLDVGCGTGYASAVLARLAGTVVALESDPALAASAQRALVAISADNVVIEQGPLTAGWASQAPYDAILLEGRVAEVPQALFDQLAPRGRLATVIDLGGVAGRAMLYEREPEGVIARRAMFDANTPGLPGFTPQARFVF